MFRLRLPGFAPEIVLRYTDRRDKVPESGVEAQIGPDRPGSRAVLRRE